MLTIRTAIDAFIEGWVYSRRMEREITLTELGAMTRVQFGDAPALKPRPDEFMIFETAPDEAVRLVRETVPNRTHRLSVFTNNGPETLEVYARHHYHRYLHEYLMARELDADHLSVPQEKISIQRVSSDAERQWFNAENSREVIPPRALNDPRIGYYFVRFGDDLACEGRCVVTEDHIAVADSIYTIDNYRRRGLGSAVMQKMLNDAARQGATYTVLAASEDGHKLYLTLGYSVLADMLVFEAD